MARAVAEHCPALLSRMPAPIDPGVEAAHLAARLAQAAQPLFARLCDDRLLTVGAAAPVATPPAEPHAAASTSTREMLYQVDGCEVIVSSAPGSLLAAFERLLGGEGGLDDECTTLPHFAAGFATRFDRTIGELIAAVCDGAETEVEAPEETATRRPAAASRTPGWHIALAITPSAGGTPWPVALWFAEGLLLQLAARTSASPAASRAVGDGGLACSPVAAAGIPLRAVLVDMSVPLARVLAFAPGSIVPVALQRNVPLMAADVVLAHGSVGTCDERVALEITRTHLTQDSQP